MNLSQTLKNALKGIYKDLWVVLLDIVAVNGAYILALLIRFYLGFDLVFSAERHFADYWRFAPYYTILCIIVFTIFRLYNNMWRYAGANDMHRILQANVVTCAIQVIGTLVFIRRMPIAYYIIGAILQVCFIIAIRFAYRIIVLERNRNYIRKQPSVNTMIVGVGEIGRRVIKYLEEMTAYRPMCVVDISKAEDGTQLDGIPIISGIEKVEEAVEKYSIQTVIIANTLISPDTRKRIKNYCSEKGLGVQDYTGFLANLGGNVSLSRLLEVVQGPLTLRVGQKEWQYQNSEEAIMDLSKHYQVRAVAPVNGRLVIDLIPFDLKTTKNSDIRNWMKQYEEQTGDDASIL